MVLWKEGKRADCAKVREQVSKAYGIEHPEKIQGFYGYFCGGGYDIWIGDAIAELMTANDTLEQELEKSLERFYRDDYGEIGESTFSENIENKYAFGCFGIVGVYTLSSCRIKVDNNDWHKIDITLLKNKNSFYDGNN